MIGLKNTLLVFSSLFFFLLPLFFLCSTPLPVDEAFKLSVEGVSNKAIRAQWDIASGYHLYKDGISILPEAGTGTILGTIVYPNGIREHSNVLGDYDVYKDKLVVDIPITKWGDNNTALIFKYQGCGESSSCYSPVSKLFSIPSPATAENNLFAPTLSSAQKLLENGNILIVFVSFFVFGIFLSLTPCVLPMIPILVGIIMGQKEARAFKAFRLSLLYVLGVAVTYTTVGIFTAVLGKSIQAVFQNFWVILLCSLIFVLLSLSLFGLYELRLPSSVMNKLNNASSKMKGGAYIGVFLMGAISSLVISPCVSAPLAGALIYIASTGNIFLGGSALFSLSLGMGVLLVIAGVTGGKLFLKAGSWMVAVRYFLGVLMLVVAVWLLFRVVPPFVTDIMFQQITKSDIFKVITTPEELQKIIAQAIKENKPVMLDYYADWCPSCKEMDGATFTNPDVRKALKSFVAVRVDITKNDANSEALRKKYNVFLPPYIVFLDNKGSEIKKAAIAGEVSPKDLLAQLKRYF